MDVATGRTWTSYEWSCGAWHAWEHLLNAYCQIFVDDRLVPRDATNLQANAQPKTFFFMPRQWWIRSAAGTKKKNVWDLCLQYQMRAVWWRGNHAALPEEKDAVNYGKCQLGPWGSSGETWVGILPYYFFERKRSAHGIGLRTRCSLCYCGDFSGLPLGAKVLHSKVPDVGN